MDHLRPNTPDVKAGCLIDILQQDFAQNKQTRSRGHLYYCQIHNTDKGLTTSPKHRAHPQSCHFFDPPFKPKGWKMCLLHTSIPTLGLLTPTPSFLPAFCLSSILM